MGQPQLVTATEPCLARGLAEYAEAVRRGESVLVRPTQAHAGLEQVVQTLEQRSKPPLFVTDLRDQADRLDLARIDGRSSGSATLSFFTSGSTGAPKCVIYERGTVDAHADAIATSLRLGSEPDLRYLALTPPGFAYGLSIVNSHLRSGTKVTFCDSDWGLASLKDAMDGADSAALYLLPQHVPLVLSSSLHLARVSRFIVAGGRLSGSAAAALAQRCPGARLTNMYGQAELGPRLSLWEGPLSAYREGSIGRPLPGVELRLDTNEEMNPLGEHIPRELLACTPFGMSWALPAPYDTIVQGPGPSTTVGTRDLALQTDDGSFVHRGRTDHVLNVAGTKVDLRRVTAMIEHEFAPIIVRADSRPARVGGDMVPVVDIIPRPDAPLSTTDIKRLLHPEFGALVALFEIRIVDRLRLKESGK